LILGGPNRYRYVNDCLKRIEQDTKFKDKSDNGIRWRAFAFEAWLRVISQKVVRFLFRKRE